MTITIVMRTKGSVTFLFLHNNVNSQSSSCSLIMQKRTARSSGCILNDNRYNISPAIKPRSGWRLCYRLKLLQSVRQLLKICPVSVRNALGVVLPHWAQKMVNALTRATMWLAISYMQRTPTQPAVGTKLERRDAILTWITQNIVCFNKSKGEFVYNAKPPS